MNYVVALFFLLIFLSGCSEYVRARRKRNEKAEQTARHKEKERGEKQKNVSLLGGGGTSILICLGTISVIAICEHHGKESSLMSACD